MERKTKIFLALSHRKLKKLKTTFSIIKFLVNELSLFWIIIITHVVIHTQHYYVHTKRKQKNIYFISSVRYGYFCVFICSIVFHIEHNIDISFNEHNRCGYIRDAARYRKRKYITNLTLTCFTSLKSFYCLCAMVRTVVCCI